VEEHQFECDVLEEHQFECDVLEIQIGTSVELAKEIKLMLLFGFPIHNIISHTEETNPYSDVMK